MRIWPEGSRLPGRRLCRDGGLRGDDEQSPVRLARRFRELAGFDSAELDEIGDLSRQAAAERKAAAAARRRAEVV